VLSCGSDDAIECASGIYDECGVCDGDGIVEPYCDCSDNVYDCEGVCAGTSINDCGGNCYDLSAGESPLVLPGCDGVCDSDAIEDICGVCNGNGIVEPYCDCFGNVLDCDEVCGGDNIVVEPYCNCDGDTECD